MPLSVNCPACREPLDVDEAYRAWTVRCPRCGREFVPDDPTGRGDRDEPDDEYDDEPRPRRRRRRRVFGEADYQAAAADAAGPAVCLEVVGWLGLLGTLAAVAMCVVAGMAAGNNPAAGNGGAELFFILGGCIGLLGLPYHAVIVVGGRKLRRLTGRGWAMAAAIMAVLTFVAFNVAGVLHVGAGVWALVVMDKPNVKAAFAHNARGGDPAPPPRDRYDDGE